MILLKNCYNNNITNQNKVILFNYYFYIDELMEYWEQKLIHNDKWFNILSVYYYVNKIELYIYII